MLSADPAVALVRAAALDYFNEVAEPFPSPNVMPMGWEERQAMCEATLSFLRQICIIEGFPVNQARKMWSNQMDQSILFFYGRETERI